MKVLEQKKDEGLALCALMISTGVETGGHPDIVGVEAISPEVAAKMRALGYTELSEDLLKAFVKSGLVENPEPGEEAFLGSVSLALSEGNS